jgi:UDP-galactopyranose mutase
VDDKSLNLSNSFSKDVICISHLRWDFVYQRPQHLLSRFSENGRVFYIEEPIFIDDQTHLNITESDNNIFLVVPNISREDEHESVILQREMLDTLISSEKIEDYILWLYTPMAMDFADHLKPDLTVFDCMDELSAFRFAPPEMIENERRLMEKADLVFTGGESLFEAKKDRHEAIYSFPSSIDKEHFLKAREIKNEPAEQVEIKSPKLGYCGVIDERMDTHLIVEMADLRPDWQFVMIGPVVKISEDELPKRSNIHYLGGKDYEDLPAYLSGWDIALMPFALNESTKYISPTKTPEYLAAGLHVISTPIRDVVKPYGENGLVEIAETSEDFVKATDKILERGNSDKWLNQVDEFLEDVSWDKTWAGMVNLIEEKLEEKNKKTKAAKVV